jgi:hypothetical protein
LRAQRQNQKLYRKGREGFRKGRKENHMAEALVGIRSPCLYNHLTSEPVSLSKTEHFMADPLLIAKGDNPLYLLPGMSNRHGLVAGATGTGKTVTLQVMAESFSRIGVPVFAADVKGDLSGISQAGQDNPKLQDRVKKLGLAGFSFAACPVTFWDVFGEQGHPVRATISEMGPLLIGRILNLNDTQAGVLTWSSRLPMTTASCCSI